jgi:hypothetical protein
VPQRPQARRRSGKPDSVGAGIIVALLGVIAREINHPVMTALRQARSAGPADPSHHGISSIAARHGRYVHQ